MSTFSGLNNNMSETLQPVYSNNESCPADSMMNGVLSSLNDGTTHGRPIIYYQPPVNYAPMNNQHQTHSILLFNTINNNVLPHA